MNFDNYFDVVITGMSVDEKTKKEPVIAGVDEDGERIETPVKIKKIHVPISTKLSRKRGGHKSVITKCMSELSEICQSSPIEVQLCKPLIKSIETQLDIIQEIESTIENELLDLSDLSDEVYEFYLSESQSYKVGVECELSRYKSIIDPPVIEKPDRKSSAPPKSVSSTFDKAHLPKITLPKFSGIIEDFLTVRGMEIFLSK